MDLFSKRLPNKIRHELQGAHGGPEEWGRHCLADSMKGQGNVLGTFKIYHQTDCHRIDLKLRLSFKNQDHIIRVRILTCLGY